KRRLTNGALLGLSADRITELAREPTAFDPPGPAADARAAADWCAAARAVQQKAAAGAERRGACGTGGRLQPGAVALVTGEPLDGGERPRRLLRPAANLAEFGCPAALAHELLTEPGRDSGLPPADVRRQIECGLAHGARSEATAKGDES